MFWFVVRIRDNEIIRENKSMRTFPCFDVIFKIYNKSKFYTKENVIFACVNFICCMLSSQML